MKQILMAIALLAAVFGASALADDGLEITVLYGDGTQAVTAVPVGESGTDYWVQLPEEGFFPSTGYPSGSTTAMSSGRSSS